MESAQAQILAGILQGVCAARCGGKGVLIDAKEIASDSIEIFNEVVDSWNRNAEIDEARS